MTVGFNSSLRASIVLYLTEHDVAADTMARDKVLLICTIILSAHTDLTDGNTRDCWVVGRKGWKLQKRTVLCNRLGDDVDMKG